MSVATDQGSTYASFAEDQLAQERQRRDRLDARGLAVLTTSAALIALLFSLTVFVTGEKYVLVEDISVALLFVAIASFVLAAVSGMLANKLRSSSVVLISGLERMVTGSRWKDSEVTARNVVAQKQIESAATLRAANEKKVGHLERALALQLFGLVSLVLAMGREMLAVLSWWP